jgi:DNA polymerase-3 subunit delta'
MTPFDEIVGQPRATEALSRALTGHRFFPSLIFHGPSGTGKLSTALALCRALLCAAKDGRPCGDCPACRKIDDRALVHPDVRVAFPEKLSDFEKGEPPPERTAGIDLQERQAEAIANPVWSILINRIRQSIRHLLRPPSEGRWSILLVDQAHRLAAESANALLKTLEEPPPHAVLILLTRSTHALLPTIRSRCQSVPFQLVPKAAIADCLRQRLGLQGEEADLRAGLADGRLGTALDLDLEAHTRRRDDLLKALEETVLRGDPGIAVARAETIARGQDHPEGDLRTLMSLLRDLMILEATGAGSGPRLIHVDIEDRLSRLADRMGATIPGAVADLDATLDAIRRKGNRQLLIENFFLSLLPPGRARPAPRAT